MSTPTHAGPGPASEPDDDAMTDSTTDSRTELMRRRQDAIEVSGWGEPFRFWQPRNACTWVFVALVVTGLFNMVHMFTPLAGYYAPAFTAGAAIAVISTLGWGWWFHHLDRFERQPFNVVLACFLWGGLGATFGIATSANGALGSLYAKLFGAAWSADWQAGLSAPFVEESAKAAGFILLLGMARRLVRTPADGLFLGAFIGLGFQTFEDFLYAIGGATGSFGSDQVGLVTNGIGTRILSDVVSHPMFSALVCAGLVYLIGTPAQPRRAGRGLLLVAAGVGFHLVLDSMLALGADTGIPSLFIFIVEIAVSLGVLWYAFRLTDGRERELARDILAPEVAGGVLTAEEVEALAGHKQRRAYLKASADRRERRRRKHVLAAALDLCTDLADANGARTADVVASRAAVERVRGGAASPELTATPA
jgi:protease PrsW